MKNRKEIIKSPYYWFEKIQNELFRQLHDYMDKNNKTQSDIAREMNVTKGYISQILNGNFNPTLKKLINFIIFLEKVPEINFVSFEDCLSENIHINTEEIQNHLNVFLNEYKYNKVNFSEKLFSASCKNEPSSNRYLTCNDTINSENANNSKEDKKRSYFFVLYNPVKKTNS